jgi:hypothetical protein
MMMMIMLPVLMYSNELRRIRNADVAAAGAALCVMT